MKSSKANCHNKAIGFFYHRKIVIRQYELMSRTGVIFLASFVKTKLKYQMVSGYSTIPYFYKNSKDRLS